MVSQPLVFKLLVILAFADASRIHRSSRDSRLDSNSSDSATGGNICSITEVSSHTIQYGVSFKFKPAKGKCSRITCNPHEFLSDTIYEMLQAEPSYKGKDGMCGCHYKSGPSKDSPIAKFLFKFKQFKNNKGGYIYDCTPKLCWQRYGQIISLDKEAERETKTMDWPRTEDFESRNHYKAECMEGATGSEGAEVPVSVLPTIHQVLKKMKNKGEDDAIANILKLVEDEPDEVEDDASVEEPVKEPPVTPDEPVKPQNSMIFVTEVDDEEDSAHHHNVMFVGVPTTLKNVVVLSPQHGTCSRNAIEYTSLSPDTVDCQLIRSNSDCGLAAELLHRSLADGEGASDIFNDMSPPAHEAVQYFSNAFRVKALMRYPPACFGRITGKGGQMHTSWNPLGVSAGNREKTAKKQTGSVANRLVCGCYDKA